MSLNLQHDFLIGPTDTDAISFCKKDGSEFSKEERDILLKELNDISPDKILWEDDGYFRRVVVLKAKNYILDDGVKVKIKGSSLRDTKRALALREMINEIIDDLLNDKNQLQSIYLKYIKEACHVRDINRWSNKKSITESVLNPERTNEQKVLDALKGTDYQQGDKKWFFYKPDRALCLVENFKGDYDKPGLIESVYKTMVIFENVIDISQFTKYHLKKNIKLLEEL